MQRGQKLPAALNYPCNSLCGKHIHRKTLVSLRKDAAYIIGLFFHKLLSQGSGTTLYNQPSLSPLFAQKPGELRTKKGFA